MAISSDETVETRAADPLISLVENHRSQNRVRDICVIRKLSSRGVLDHVRTKHSPLHVSPLSPYFLSLFLFFFISLDGDGVALENVDFRH